MKISDELDELEQMMMENQYMEEMNASVMQPQGNPMQNIEDIRQKYQVSYPSLGEPEYLTTHEQLVQKAKAEVQALRD